MAVQRATAVLGSAVLCLLALLEGSSDFVSLLRNIEPHVSQNVLDMPAFSIASIAGMSTPLSRSRPPIFFQREACHFSIAQYIYIAGILWLDAAGAKIWSWRLAVTHDWTTCCCLNFSSVLKIVEIILSIASLQQLEAVSCSAAQVSGLPQGQDARLQRLGPLVQVILVSACPLRTPYFAYSS